MMKMMDPKLMTQMMVAMGQMMNFMPKATEEAGKSSGSMIPSMPSMPMMPSMPAPAQKK